MKLNTIFLVILLVSSYAIDGHLTMEESRVKMSNVKKELQISINSKVKQNLEVQPSSPLKNVSSESSLFSSNTNETSHSDQSLDPSISEIARMAQVRAYTHSVFAVIVLMYCLIALDLVIIRFFPQYCCYIRDGLFSGGNKKMMNDDQSTIVA